MTAISIAVCKVIACYLPQPPCIHQPWSRINQVLSKSAADCLLPVQVDAVVEAARSALTLQAARQANSLLDSLPPDLWARLQERLRTSVAAAEKVCR